MAFSADRGEIHLFAGISLQNPALHALLAMQKVEGSNPFSRCGAGKVWIRGASAPLRFDNQRERRWSLSARRGWSQTAAAPRRVDANRRSAGSPFLRCLTGSATSFKLD
jgi:hypothetical protein